MRYTVILQYNGLLPYPWLGSLSDGTIITSAATLEDVMAGIYAQLPAGSTLVIG